MYRSSLYLISLILSACAVAAPVLECSRLSDPNYGPKPGESELFNVNRGESRPFPAYCTDAILPTVNGQPGPDDILFQNLLAAEWVIFSFYQYGVETYSPADFERLGLPNTTYARLQEIRDNEAGHLRIFQNAISTTSTKPGPCKYTYPFNTAQDFLVYLLNLEIGSMIFTTGLARQAKLKTSSSTLAAIGITESRHNTWGLIDLYGANPFGGPVDTTYPYANQLLSLTVSPFVEAGSCPSANPIYPFPDQNLPEIGFANSNAPITPGSPTKIKFNQPDNQPKFAPTKQYYAVFNHATLNITMPFDTKTNTTTIPSQFEKNKGAIVMVIADLPGAPTVESCVAGPMIFLEQPVALQ